MKNMFLGLFLLLMVTNEALAQSFTATVNRNPVPEGETFVLTLNLQDVETKATPDLSSLSKDLTVLSISNGYRTSIVNGDVSKSRQWNLVLIPNRSGDIPIPSIELEGLKTQPISIQVVPIGSQDKLVDSQVIDSPKFKMSGQIDNMTPYVGQQINYQLKIYDGGGLQGEAPFFATNNDDWTIRSLGEPIVETKVVNGKSLREIIFNYALFASKSGDLMIPPVRFNGYYLTKNTRQDPFARFFDDDQFFSGFGLHDVFASKTPIVLNTKPIKIDVRPAAVEEGWWLPAKEIKLSAEFDNKYPQFKVGEAISRTIYIKAVGVLDTQLPEINFAKVDGIKQYPEKPLTEMKVENGNVVSFARISNVYIPEKSGEVILPAIKLNWFNTVTNTPETAVIPEYNVIVTGVSKNENLKQFEETDKNISNNELSQTTAQSVEIVENVNNNKVIWLLIGAFVGGIVITLMLIKLFSYLTKVSDKQKKSVISAAKNKDLHALKDEILVWAREKFPRHSINNLQDVADAINVQAFNKELDKIRETLYADNEKDWDEKAFLDVFCKIACQLKKRKKTIHEPLPKLYK